MNKMQAENAAEDVAQRLPWDLPRFRNWIAVAKTYALVDRALTRGFAPLGLKCAQYDLLAVTYRFPGLTQQELADRLLVGRSNMSMLLPGMIKRGLIERKSDPGDARLKRLHLTPKGHSLTETAMQVQTNVIEHMMGALTHAECDALGDMMRRVGRYMAEGDRG